MPNWKSTAAGLLTAAFGFVAFSPDLFAHWPWLIALAKYAMLGGIVGLGKVTKDASTHSTAVQVQEATIEANAKAMDRLDDRGSGL